jgi:non-ribosomal peptide synthetase component E (peptide arylation enzyme)
VPADTIPHRLLQRAKKSPNDPAYYVREGGGWKSTNWGTYSDQVTRAGRALIALGLEPGDTVCILGFNRPEWAIMDLAAMGAGGAPAGIYTTCSPIEVRYIIAHAEAPLVLVENEEQWRKVKAERANMPKLKYVVTMKGAPVIADEMVMSWEEFMAKGDEVEEKVYSDRVASLIPNALATLPHRLRRTARFRIFRFRTSPSRCSRFTYRLPPVPACTLRNRSKQCRRTSRRYSPRSSSACLESGRSSRPASLRSSRLQPVSKPSLFNGR